jgi:hypothetical protein
VRRIFLENDEIKFCVLYALRSFETPINIGDLATILTLEPKILEYFELSIALSELVEDKYITNKNHRGAAHYLLTKLGEDTANFFAGRVPPSVRARIDEAVQRIKYDTLVSPKKITAEALPVSENEFMVLCRVIDQKSPLMELKLYVGREKDASAAAEFFENNACDVYAKIIEIFGLGGGAN